MPRGKEKKPSLLKGTKTPLFEWFVTVYGVNGYYSPSFEFCSTTILLPDNQTPVDWFLKRPKVYSRFEFTPAALLYYERR